MLTPGRRLRPQDVGVAATLGRASLEVYRALDVALLSTGDELVPPGRYVTSFFNTAAWMKSKGI